MLNLFKQLIFSINWQSQVSNKKIWW